MILGVRGRITIVIGLRGWFLKGGGGLGGLDKGRLREGVRELERALWDAWDGADGAEEVLEVERAFYGRFAGASGV